MTIGVGGSTAEAELAAMRSLRGDAPAIDIDERMARVARAQALMRDKGIDALRERSECRSSKNHRRQTEGDMHVPSPPRMRSSLQS